MTKSYTVRKNFRSVSITASILVTIIAISPLLLAQNQGNAQGKQVVPGSLFKLASASIPIDIPMGKGYENGNEIFFIATDASDEKIAEQATKLLDLKSTLLHCYHKHQNQHAVKPMRLPMVFQAKDHLDFKYLYWPQNLVIQDIVHFYK